MYHTLKLTIKVIVMTLLFAYLKQKKLHTNKLNTHTNILATYNNQVP